MTNLKSLTLAAILSLGFAGAASAQVFPGAAGTPGRGNSDPVALMPNGAPVSNGYMAEPEDFQRARIVRAQREQALVYGAPETAFRR